MTEHKIPLGRWLVLVVSGILIGGGAILPGVSGGVLCVVFGIYRPMMELLSRPRAAVPKYWRIFVPVLIGWAAGFLFFARVIGAVFEANETLATWLFIGLIAGTVPGLWKDAGEQGRSARGYISAAVACAALLAVLLPVRYGSGTQLSPSFLWYVFCGVLWGLSLIVPGMSSSPVLMSLGLYVPLANGIGSLDISVLIPWILGMAATVLALARFINYLFEKHYSIASHGVTGVVVASMLVTVPTVYTGAGQIVLCVLCFAVGFAGALLLERLGSRKPAPGKEVG